MSNAPSWIRDVIPYFPVKVLVIMLTCFSFGQPSRFSPSELDFLNKLHQSHQHRLLTKVASESVVMNGHVVLKVFEEPNCKGLAGTFVLALGQCIQTSYSGISEMFGAVSGSSGFSVVIYSYGNSQCSGNGVKNMTVQYNFNTQCVNDGFGSSSAAITTSAPEFKSGLLTRFSLPPPFYPLSTLW